MPKFHERLKLLRRETGLSQQDLANQIGTSKSSINMYERGEREPGLETLEAFADYFNVDMDYLLGKSEHRSKIAWLEDTELSRDKSHFSEKQKKENPSQRLKKLMQERNLKQKDILDLAAPYCKQYHVKLGKSDLSQYVSGKVEPGQDKLAILGLALNVSEAWLMGYDVPMKCPNGKIEFTTLKDDELIKALKARPLLRDVATRLANADDNTLEAIKLLTPPSDKSAK